jgi:hypothetical protein
LNGTEAKELVTSLMQDFSDLHASCKFRHDITHARHGFNSSSVSGITIESKLRDAGYPIIVPVVSREVDWAASKTVERLSRGYEIHIEPRHPIDMPKADKLEIVDANQLLTWDGGGKLSHAIHRHQAVSPYAGLKINKVPYAPPKRKTGEKADDYNRRVKRWEENYSAFMLSVEDPLSLAFLEDGLLNVTMFVHEYEWPVIDFLEAYGTYDKAEYASDPNPILMFHVMEQQFPSIRAGYKMADWSPAFYSRKKLKVCEVDNGQQIRIYLQSNDTTIHDLIPLSDLSEGGSYPNSFGRPCLFPVPGRWNPDATKPEDRYEPLLVALMQSRWNLDFTWSQWASRAAERPTQVSELPPQVSLDIMRMEEEERDRFLLKQEELKSGRLNQVLGKVSTLDTGPSEYMSRLYSEQRSEHSQYVPGAALSGNEENRVILSRAPTSSIIRLDELTDEELGMAYRLKYNAFVSILEAHDSYWKANPDKELAMTASGEEKVKGKSIPRGYQIRMKSSDWDFDFVRSINRFDDRASTMMANLDIVYKRMSAPDGQSYVLDEEVVTALGKTNSTEYLAQLRAERRYKNVENLNDALNIAASLERDAALYGIDKQELLLRMGQTAPSGGSPPAPAGVGGTQVVPPARDSVPLGVNG